MKTEINEITINGKVYVEKGSNDSLPLAKSRDGMSYCIVRTQSAGVFAGYVESRSGKEGVIRDARRLWYWSGAASLSQLSVDGTCKPKECKFPCAVDEVQLTEIIEVLKCTEKAKQSILGVAVWEQK